jgi:hypothetical protein
VRSSRLPRRRLRLRRYRNALPALNYRPRYILIRSFGFSLRLRLRLPFLLQQIQILLRRDGLRTGLFRLLPRVFRLLPVYLAHLFHLSLVLLLVALLLIALQRPLLIHLALVNLFRGWLSKRQRARNRNQQPTKSKHGFHAI